MGLGYFTDYERRLKCLVCGFNHKHGRDVPLALLLDAASRISDAMLDHGWPNDAYRLRDALHASRDEGVCAEQVGQQLLLERDHLFRKAGDASRALAASLARYWPTSGA